jgi:uncharacterized repeat protein (TIGR04138 family)
MTELNLEEKLQDIADLQAKYDVEAYKFIFDSLDYVLVSNGKYQYASGDRHVSVEQLLDGIKDFALEQFGPLSRIVLEEWGIYCTEDIGEIVFDLVDGGLLNKQESDDKRDFSRGFSFREVFEENYVPEIPWATA